MTKKSHELVSVTSAPKYISCKNLIPPTYAIILPFFTTRPPFKTYQNPGPGPQPTPVFSGFSASIASLRQLVLAMMKAIKGDSVGSKLHWSSNGTALNGGSNSKKNTKKNNKTDCILRDMGLFI